MQNFVEVHPAGAWRETDVTKLIVVLWNVANASETFRGQGRCPF